jgi:hypothetical protein
LTSSATPRHAASSLAKSCCTQLGQCSRRSLTLANLLCGTGFRTWELATATDSSNQTPVELKRQMNALPTCVPRPVCPTIGTWGTSCFRWTRRGGHRWHAWCAGRLRACISATCTTCCACHSAKRTLAADATSRSRAFYCPQSARSPRRSMPTAPQTAATNSAFCNMLVRFLSVGYRGRGTADRRETAGARGSAVVGTFAPPWTIRSVSGAVGRGATPAVRRERG